MIVAGWGSATEPVEIVRVDPAAKTRTRLTDFSVAAAAAIDWTPLDELWFTNGRGRRIHSFVVRPPGFDPTRKYPLLVLIHGGHANMWRDSITLRWNYHLLASPGYVVLLTDYRGSTGYGEAFTSTFSVTAAGAGRGREPGRRRGDSPLPLHRRLEAGRGGASTATPREPAEAT